MVYSIWFESTNCYLSVLKFYIKCTASELFQLNSFAKKVLEKEIGKDKVCVCVSACGGG